MYLVSQGHEGESREQGKLRLESLGTDANDDRL